MKVVNLPAEELRVALLGSDAVVYRREQANSNLPNHAEFGQAWMQGYRYGVEAALASFQPNEAQAQLDAIREMKKVVDEYEQKLARKVESAEHTKNYYRASTTRRETKE